MATFNYKAKTPTGEVISGRFDALDKNTVISLLKSKGFLPMQIEESNAHVIDSTSSSFGRITSKDLTVFCRQFYTMLNAGVPVIGCLDMLRKQTENRKFAIIINKVYDNVQKGKTLSESMKIYNKAFPLILVSMVEMGEVSGTLDKVLVRLADHFQKENSIKQKIKTAMIYPAVIGSIAVIVVIFMLAFIIPTFVGMFKSFGAELPLPTRILLGASNLMTNPIFIMSAIAFTVVFLYIFSKFKASEKGRSIIDNILIRIPILGKNIRKVLASRFTRTLSSLLGSGIPLIQSLEVVEKVVNNRIVSKGMLKVMEEIKRGSNLAGPLEAIEIFPQMVTQMIRVGEETGSIDAIMEKVADYYDDEVDAAISQMIALIEPVMIFVLALVVGSIVISMILPIFSLYGKVG